MIECHEGSTVNSKGNCEEFNFNVDYYSYMSSGDGAYVLRTSGASTKFSSIDKVVLYQGTLITKILVFFNFIC